MKKHIPNILSSIRLLSPIVLIPLILLGFYKISILVLCFFLLTDIFDGYLARKWNVISELGGKIDACADKTILFSTLIPLILKNPILIILAIFELIISIINIIRKIKGGNPKTVFIGKIKMVFISIIISLYYLKIIVNIKDIYCTLLLSITVILEILTTLTYYEEFREEKLKRFVNKSFQKR